MHRFFAVVQSADLPQTAQNPGRSDGQQRGFPLFLPSFDTVQPTDHQRQGQCARTEDPGTPAAERFALGRVLYEALTGLDRRQYPELPADFGRLQDFFEARISLP